MSIPRALSRHFSVAQNDRTETDAKPAPHNGQGDTVIQTHTVGDTAGEGNQWKRQKISKLIRTELLTTEAKGELGKMEKRNGR